MTVRGKSRLHFPVRFREVIPLTVTATATSGNTSLTHTTNLGLNVN